MKLLTNHGNLNKYAVVISVSGIFNLLSCQEGSQANIYLEDRQVTYAVEFIDSTEFITCTDTIILSIPPEKFFDWRRLVTGQITHHYKYEGHCMAKTKETTGIKETKKVLFLHPPRMDRMIITELGAFPQMFYPIKVGAHGSGTLQIINGYGSWDGLKISYSDQVVRIVDTTIAGISYNQLAFRNGIADNTPVGPMRTSHSFSSKYGWVSGHWVTDSISIYMYAVDYNW